MSQYCRVKSLLVFVLIFTCANLPGAQAGVLSDAPPSPLELQIVPPQMIEGESATYGLKIVNHADHEIVIQRGIEVDTLINFKWVARMRIEANANCASPALIRIAAGSTFDIVPWDGYQCSNGCNTECDDHRPLGPGTYQFVVVTAEGQRQPSPSFTLP